jgi:hypothetical protein
MNCLRICGACFSLRILVARRSSPATTIIRKLKHAPLDPTSHFRQEKQRYAD